MYMSTIVVEPLNFHTIEVDAAISLANEYVAFNG